MYALQMNIPSLKPGVSLYRDVQKSLQNDYGYAQDDPNDPLQNELFSESDVEYISLYLAYYH